MSTHKNIPPLLGPQHLIIRASAGTGKTFSLSNRYLSLLRRHAKPDTILATTFTRKAAGEILQRVLLRLADAAIDQKDTDELAGHLEDDSLTTAGAREMLAGLTTSLHRTTIATIDSFFHAIALCFRHELNIAPGVQVVDDNSPIATQLRHQAIDAMLGDSDTQLLVDLLRRIHHDKTKPSITDAIDKIVADLYQIYQQTFGEQSLWEKLVCPPTLGKIELAESLNGLQQLCETAEGKRLVAALNGNYHAAIAGNWRGFLEKGLAKPINEGKDTYYSKPIEPATLDLYDKLVAHANAVELNYVAHQTRASYDLLSRFNEHYSRLRRASNIVLFSDIPLQLVKTLEENEELSGELYYRLDTHVTHLMLDEFQDTSPTQWKILKPFADEICSYDDPKYCERTFFCVGDTKQAIYGWRGGSAAIFTELEKGLPLGPRSFETLNKSYRSSQIVLDTVNHVFNALPRFTGLDGHSDILDSWGKEFISHETAKPELPGYVEFSTTNPSVDPKFANEAHEQSVADYVQEIAQAAPNHSIGILVRKRKTIHRLVHILRQRGLAASGEGANPLTDDPAVSVILSALTLADHPGHTTAAFHVLNSPLAAIINLESTDHKHCIAITQQIRHSLIAQGYAKTIAKWARELAKSCNEQTTGKLEQLIELADQYQPLVSLRPSHFVEYIKQSDVEQQSAANIRVMTIHKAKGLEFDIVVLPELSSSVSYMSTTPTCVTRDDPAGPITGIYRGTNAQTRAASEQLQEAFFQEEARTIGDNLCGIYVAMTRPKHALYMIAKPLKQTKKGEVSHTGYPADSYAAILRNTLDLQDEEFDVAQRLYRHGDEKWYEQAGAVKQATGEETLEEFALPNIVSDKATRFIPHTTPSSMEDAGRINLSNILNLEENAAALRGSVIHKLFETVDWLDGPGDLVDETQLLAIANLVAPQMDTDWRELQVRSFLKIIEQVNVKKCLNMSQYNAAGDDLVLLREHNFAIEHKNQLITGSFDRVVVEYNKGNVARAHIIDYKTDHVGADRGNLDELVKRYRPQIIAYRNALAEVYKLKQNDITADLLFTAADVAVGIS